MSYEERSVPEILEDIYFELKRIADKFDKEEEDNILREYIKKLETKFDTLNKRTKIHTMDIRDLKRKLK